MALLDLNINGTARPIEVSPDTPLLEVLRDHLGLTGAKYGCGEGQCGACTVLVDDKAVLSCLAPVKQAVGKRVVTIEGLAEGGRLHPVQQAFLLAGAFQCGYCTSGAILGTVSLLKSKPDPSDAEVARELSVHVCRCGSYPRIVEAVRMAARRGRA